MNKLTNRRLIKKIRKNNGLMRLKVTGKTGEENLIYRDDSRLAKI